MVRIYILHSTRERKTEVGAGRLGHFSASTQVKVGLLTLQSKPELAEKEIVATNLGIIRT